MHNIGDAVGSWLYVIAGALAFAEASFLVGFVLPGETALLVAGYFCRYGPLNVWVMAAVAVFCAIVGDTVGFEFGRFFGPSLRRSRVGQWIGEPRWIKGEQFLHRHGGKAVFLGRLVALLRALTPSMAGMSGMHYPTFLRWNAAGGLLWGAGCVFLGYGFASALNTVSKYLTWLPIAVLALVVVGYLALHLRKRKQEREQERAYVAGADEA
jgi:membrane protein DedA with SNARE-associated domain